EGDKSISHLSQWSFCSSFLMYLGTYLIISILVPSSGPFNDLMDFLVLIIYLLSRMLRETYYPLLMEPFQTLIFSNGFALSDLDEMAIRVTNVGTHIELMIFWFSQEFCSSLSPLIVAGVNISYTNIHEAADFIWIMGCS